MDSIASYNNQQSSTDFPLQTNTETTTENPSNRIGDMNGRVTTRRTDTEHAAVVEVLKAEERDRLWIDRDLQGLMEQATAIGLRIPEKLKTVRDDFIAANDNYKQVINNPITTVEHKINQYVKKMALAKTRDELKFLMIELNGNA